MAQDSGYQSYLDLERRSSESQPDSQWIPLSPPSVLQPYGLAPPSLPPPGYSQRPPTGFTQRSLQQLTIPVYNFPSLSGSMPTLTPTSASTSYSPQSQTQSRMRPGSQVNSADIKYLSSPPGISHLSLPSGPPLSSIESHPRSRQTTLVVTQPSPTASTATLSCTRGGAQANVATNGPTSSSIVTSQPIPTTVMSINFKGSRNAKCLPTGEDGKREWSAGLFGCIKERACGECCLAWWCPCIVYGRNKRRLDHLSQLNAPDPKGSETICNSDCALHCCLTGCMFGWALQVPNRSVVRSRYSIRGSGYGDCCTTFWCSSCELAQESQEIGLEEKSFP